MSEIDYTDPKYKDAAFALAEATPRHLDRPTTPPIHWRLEGDVLRVLLADGRTVRAPLVDYLSPHFGDQKKDKKPAAPPVPDRGKLMASVGRGSPDPVLPPAPVGRGSPDPVLPPAPVGRGSPDPVLPPANLKKRPSSRPPTNFKAGH